LFRVEQIGFKKHPEQRDIIYIQSIGGGVATWMITTTSSSHDVREPKLRDEVYFKGESVTSQDVRLEIESKQECALHSCIKNLGNICAFK
jgi:hypothetical protein